MSEYIERGALEAKAVYMHGFGKNKYVPLKAIQQATAADVVARAAYDQVAWERDLAIEQLREDYGVGLGEKKPADVVELKHGRCPVCNGEKAILQDCYNGVSVEVDAEQQEMSVWLGDECFAVFSIDYCPNCGAKMDL